MQVTITESIVIKKVIELPAFTEDVEQAAREHIDSNNEWVEWGNGWEPVHSDGIDVYDITTPCMKVGSELLICEHPEDHDHLLTALKEGSSDLNLDTMPSCDYSVSIGDEQPVDGIYTIAGTRYQPVHEAE